MSVIRVSRCGITRGTLSGKHVLTLIWIIMTGGSFKIVSNWAVLIFFFRTTQRTVVFVRMGSLGGSARRCRGVLLDRLVRLLVGTRGGCWSRVLQLVTTCLRAQLSIVIGCV